MLVTGASGGVGRFAIQLAHLGGAEVTALDSSNSARAAGLRELGADEVVPDIDQLRGRFDLVLESLATSRFLWGWSPIGSSIPSWQESFPGTQCRRR